jgi:ABC-type bacteriocin/lantibiotic exporter with double-glycine peptidase domain
MPDQLSPSADAALSLQAVAIGALRDVALRLAPGEIVCLSGASGSGKSRLLRAVADLDPHDGDIRLGDQVQGKIPGHCWRRQVMLVPAESQWWHDTVGEHFGAALGETVLAEALRALNLSPDAPGWQAARLSSGEKQRLALLRAVSHAPVALLLDEPTANLDGQSTQATEHWLQSLARAQALPLLWVAHDPAQIRRVADRHYHIDGDHLVQRA